MFPANGLSTGLIRIFDRDVLTTVDELHSGADALVEGCPLTDELGPALVWGTSIGGARPKALVDIEGVRHIAKFSSRSDPYPVVNAEALAFELARRVGIDTMASFLTTSLGRDVLIILPASAAFACDPAAVWPKSLRVKSVQGAPGLWEMTWSFGSLDGRATFEFVTVEAELRCRWRRVGDHDVFKDP